jgi:hypothetical protein
MPPDLDSYVVLHRCALIFSHRQRARGTDLIALAPVSRVDLGTNLARAAWLLLILAEAEATTAAK